MTTLPPIPASPLIMATPKFIKPKKPFDAERAQHYITTLVDQLSALESDKEKLTAAKKRIEIINKVATFLFSVACTITALAATVTGPLAIAAGGSVAAALLGVSIATKCVEVKRQVQLDQLDQKIELLHRKIYLATLTAHRKLAS